MNLVDKALAVFDKHRKKKLVETIRITTADGAVDVQASVIEPESSVHPEGIRSKTHQYIFLVNSSGVDTLRITRGARILRRNETYEVVFDGGYQEDYNDPNEQDIAIPAKKCS